MMERQRTVEEWEREWDERRAKRQTWTRRPRRNTTAPLVVGLFLLALTVVVALYVMDQLLL
jgi:cell division septal protein FtsQ